MRLTDGFGGTVEVADSQVERTIRKSIGDESSEGEGSLDTQNGGVATVFVISDVTITFAEN